MSNDSILMQDFIFGHLEADAGLLESERRRLSGLRHGHAISPLRPRAGQPVRISVQVGPGIVLDAITAYVTLDGTEPRGQRGQAINGIAIPLQPSETTWIPVHWDYGEIWQAEIPAQPLGTQVRYRIEGWRQREPGFSIWSSEANMDGTPALPAVYGYSVDDYTTPAWAHEAVIYQIVVDRFAPAPPHYLRPSRLSLYSGGTLQGIRQKLGYIQDLGVNAVWLTPIFASPTYHGYDTSDYFEINPHFGSKEGLRKLVNDAHARGIRIILDFVANHTSVQFAPFREALRDASSPYRHWYSFSDAYKHGYRCFFDVASMPQLNLDHPAARAYVLDAAQYWLREFNIDGYRLDYAAGPSHDFWTAFRLACKEVNPDCWLVGEVTLGSADLRSYVGRLDGCLDFGFTRQMRLLLSKPAPADIESFASSLIRSHHFFPPDFTRPSFVENHDMNRLLAVLHGDRESLKLAIGLLLALGSTPILYYGTEVGLSQPRLKGPHREESRHPMLWGDQQDAELLAYFRRLIRWRRQHPAAAYGDLQTLRLHNKAGVWLVQRRYADDTVLVLINVGADSRTVTLPPGDWARDDGSLLSADDVVLPPRSVTLLASA